MRATPAPELEIFPSNDPSLIPSVTSILAVSQCSAIPSFDQFNIQDFIREIAESCGFEEERIAA
jgi:hypothetical protein